jgi:glycerol-3-phosphate acyltransferase PlsY
MVSGTELIVISACYALGCLSTGYYLVRFRTGRDVRLLGSGSAGSMNVSRALGTPGFVVTFLGDVAKGATATLAAVYFGLGPWGVMLAVVAVVAGHIWPVQLRFRGGKGLATALGAVLLFDYWLVIAVVIVAAITLAVARNPTMSAMIAVAAAPGVAAIMGHPFVDLIGISMVALFILNAHRSNIREIVGGASPRSGGGE